MTTRRVRNTWSGIAVALALALVACRSRLGLFSRDAGGLDAGAPALPASAEPVAPASALAPLSPTHANFDAALAPLDGTGLDVADAAFDGEPPDEPRPPAHSGVSARSPGVRAHVELPLGSGPELLRLGPPLKQCYTRGLARNPHQQGAPIVTVALTPAGEVTSALVRNDGLEDELVECIRTAIRKVAFDPAIGDGRTYRFQPRFTLTER